MIGIVFASIGIVMCFLLIVVVAILAIVGKIRKSPKTRRHVITLVLATVLFFGLIATDILLISGNIREHKQELAQATEDTAMQAAELTGKGLVKTFDAFVAAWDKRSTERMKNITLTVVKSENKVENGQKTYTVEVLFNNLNKTNAESISSMEMVAGNSLVFCDAEDIVYAIDDTINESFNLPAGKTKATLLVNVDEGVNLTYIRFIDQKIPLGSE